MLTSASFIIILNCFAIYNYVYKYHGNREDPNTSDISKEAENTKAFSKKTYNYKIDEVNLKDFKMNKYRSTQTFYETRKLLNATSEVDEHLGDYPPDAFTLEQKKNGYIVFHVIGVCYMFLGLAIVCDEFFVPALHVISTILKISDDVAGATFMAAGGSAPELFISIIGVFISKSNVGFGTIVGSAVFNILFVIGMCAMFSKTVLQLTWWPLLRDCLFYITALIILICFFQDQKIEYWEAIILFFIYICYVSFMALNEKIERLVKNYLSRKKKSSCVRPLQDESYGQVFLSFQSSLSKNSFRNGALQLVIHTLDPIAEANVENKFNQIRDHCEYNSSVTPRQVITIETDNESTVKTNGNHFVATDTIRASEFDSRRFSSDTEIRAKLNHQDSSRSLPVQAVTNLFDNNNNASLFKSKDRVSSPQPDVVLMRRLSRSSSRSSQRRLSKSLAAMRDDETTDAEVSVPDEDEEPLDFSWPTTLGGRIFYIIKLPLVLLLSITLPDVRRPSLWKFFPITFIGSILWIGGFTYLMVWWTAEIGNVFDIDDEIMGLTFLAAGTSIPDLITSVVVARQGFGDMAVSSSVGSNIFDVTVGLPLPWMISSFTRGFKSVIVKSDGLFCSTILLFIMLIAVVIAIAVSKWRMTKALGLTMFFLYVVFIAITLLIQLNQIPCFL